MNMIDNNDAPVVAGKAGAGAYNAQVRDFLNERLKQHGTDCEQLFITTVNSATEPKVTFSQDLLALGNDTLEWETVQAHAEGLVGIFSKHWTFEDEHSFSKLSVPDVEALMHELLAEARNKWFA